MANSIPELNLDDIPDVTDAEREYILRYLGAAITVPDDVETVTAQNFFHLKRSEFVNGERPLDVADLYRLTVDGHVEFALNEQNTTPSPFKPLLKVQGGRLHLFHTLNDYGVPGEQFLQVVILDD